MVNVLRALRLLVVCSVVIGAAQVTHAEVNPAATALAWNPDGSMLAVGGSDGVTLYTPEMMAIARLPDTRSDVSALGWSSDGKKLAVGRYDGLIRVWDVAAKDVFYTLHGHIGAVNALAWGEGDRLLASAGDDLSVRVWDATTQIALLDKHRDRVYALAWGANVPILISGGAENAVWLWQQDMWSVVPLGQYHTRPVYAAAWNADGTIYATASGDKTIRLGEPDGTSLGGYTQHTDRVIALGWRPDGTLLSASWDHTIRLWTQGTREGQVLVEDLPDRVRVVAFSPDGERYALITAEGVVEVRVLSA